MVSLRSALLSLQKQTYKTFPAPTSAQITRGFLSKLTMVES